MEGFNSGSANARHRFARCRMLYLTMVVHAAGCGTLKNHDATDQLLISAAVDQSIAQVDFSALGGQRVYLDTRFINPVKSVGFVNADYIISSLRQQMVASNCLLQESEEQADFIVEARVGALGSDDHEVNYGIPASNAINAASSLYSGPSPVPVLPEISIAKHSDAQAAAKIALFAYHRETKQPVWQSGLSKGVSTARSTWVMGIGPFQRGTIYDSAQFAGSPIRIPKLSGDDEGEHQGDNEASRLVFDYYKTRVFQYPAKNSNRGSLSKLASHEEEIHGKD